MQLAVDQAARGMRAGEGGPFGACIIKDERVVCCASNTVLRDRDPTAHAEINAIRAAAKKLASFWLTGCVMFSTSEPCPMCTGAIYWARLSTVYFGCGDKIAADAGFDDRHVYNEINRPPGARQIPFTPGILADACTELFNEWSAMKHKTHY